MMYGWSIKDKSDLGQDLSDLFVDLMEECKQGYYNLPKKAEKYTYFLIPGLYAQNLSILRHMEDMRCIMDDLGLYNIRIDIDTGGTVKQNAKTIRDYIKSEYRETRKKCIIIGHSKGGVDAGTAVAKYNLYKYVKGIIMIQAPWAGTLIAEETGLMKYASNFANYITNTNNKALRDLSYENRKKTIKKYPLDINRIKVLCMASLIGKKFSISQISAALIKRKYNIDTDGIVGFEDVVVPGSDYVNVNELAHSDIVFGKVKDNESGDMIYSLIWLLLNTVQKE